MEGNVNSRGSTANCVYPGPGRLGVSPLVGASLRRLRLHEYKPPTSVCWLLAAALGRSCSTSSSWTVRVILFLSPADAAAAASRK